MEGSQLKVIIYGKPYKVKPDTTVEKLIKSVAGLTKATESDITLVSEDGQDITS